MLNDKRNKKLKEDAITYNIQYGVLSKYSEIYKSFIAT